MFNLDHLNDQQRQAVCYQNGPLLILAGAGTGKTSVVTSRIAYMILHLKIPAREITAVTFTNKAAREMRERLTKLVPPEALKSMTVGTFHSFCLKLLRRYYLEAGLKKGFMIIPISDQLDLVRKALDDLGWSGLYKTEDVHSSITWCKNRLIGPDQLALRPDNPIAIKAQPLKEIYALYEKQLKMNNVIDFDDCILLVYTMLQNSALKDHISSQYKHFMIDEFQDTNHGQFQIIALLGIKNQSVCVVGDDDQSIYSWRGAMVANIHTFQDVFPTTCTIKLEQNYRCSPAILATSNQLIQHNTDRMTKTLWSQSQHEEPVFLYSFDNQEDEAQFIARRCHTLLSQKHSLSEIAILYRTNSQSRALELALYQENLPYKTFGGQSFFERKEIRDFFSYIRLILNPHDRLALLRIINVPPRGIGLKTQELLVQEADHQNRNLFETLKTLPNQMALTHTQTSSIFEFCQTIDELKALPLNTPEDVIELGVEIIKRFHLQAYVRSSSKNARSQLKKVEDLKQLPHLLGRYASRIDQETKKTTLEHILEYVTLDEKGQNVKEEEDSSYVSLMTIHSAKGLEFPVIFIAGVEEGFLPHKNSIESSLGIEEERRLFYVALTRAKKSLTLTYSKNRQLGFQSEKRKQSRFISELPQNPQIFQIIDRASQPIVPKEIMQKQTLSKLQMLKSELRPPK